MHTTYIWFSAHNRRLSICSLAEFQLKGAATWTLDCLQILHGNYFVKSTKDSDVGILGDRKQQIWDDGGF